MKPYYEDAAVQIFLGDAFDIVPRLAPADVILTDPDYNGKDIGVRQGHYGDEVKVKLSDEDYANWCQKWFHLARQKSQRIVFSPGIDNMYLYPRPKWILAWFKPGAVSYNKYGGFNIWEPILTYGDGPRITQDAYESTPLNFTREGREHPCPKHPGLWQWVLDSVSRPGETVLDFFAGSGTTGRVAKNLGRKAILVERVERYCEIAAKRMSQSVMDLECLTG